MPSSLPRLWAATVARNPTAVALIDQREGRSWSRAELAEGARAWQVQHAPTAAWRGRRVLLAAPNGLAWFQAFLGLLEAGAVPVLIDPAEPPGAQLGAAQAVGAAGLTHGETLETLPSRRARAPSTHCLIKLTSGSSGTPRGFVFTHAQMAADGSQVCAGMGITRQDRNLAVIPLGHSYGLGNLVVPLLLQGTALCCAESPLPQALAAACARWRPTIFPAVPPLIRLLVLSDVPAEAFASVRLVISAGAVLPPATAQAFHAKFGRRVHGFYGSSETGGITYDRSGHATLTGRSVGRPLPGVRLRFTGLGRFTVRSAAVKRPGVHRPGDRGELNGAGELVLRGRTDRTVKVAGRRVDLAEVEAALLGVPQVREAFAGGHPHKEGTLSAVLATEVSIEAVRAHLRDRLAPWKIPARIVTVPDFPTTARGKPDTRRLRQWLGVNPPPPRP